MNRYDFTTIKPRFDGKRIYSSTYYPIIPVKDSDIYIITSETTMLDSLADKYYKDVSLWWVIYKANQLKGGSVGVPMGIQLRIPVDIQPILDEFKKINQ